MSEPLPPAPADRQRLHGFVVGVDLGQARDFSAVVVNDGASTKAGEVFHNVVALHRFALGTSYLDVVAGVAKVLAQLPPRRERPVLVVDMARERLGWPPPISVTITGGDATSNVDDDWRVAKRQLASIMQVALQTGRMKIAADMPLSPVLIRELESFKVKINVATGNESFESWREQDHDDLVLATAIAAWYSEEKAKACDLVRLVGMGWDDEPGNDGRTTSYQRMFGLG